MKNILNKKNFINVVNTIKSIEYPTGILIGDFSNNFECLLSSANKTKPDMMMLRWEELSLEVYSILRDHIDVEPVDNQDWKVLIVSALCNSHKDFIFDNWSEIKKIAKKYINNNLG